MKSSHPRARKRRIKERLIETGLLAAACSSVAVTFAIIFILLKESLNFFAEVPLIDFLTDTQWTPLFDDAHFGIITLISGTVTTTLVALSDHCDLHQ
jgi:phosphate transport system permease protein